MNVLEHEHPLKLVDLRLEYPPYEEEEEEKEEEDDDDDDDEGGGDLVKKEDFSEVACDRCGQVISMYHMYYYKCMGGDSSSSSSSCECRFSLHKFCAELSPRLDHALHQHPLIQGYETYYFWTCDVCNQMHTDDAICYKCDECSFYIDLKCAVEVGKRIIHHPCHPHALICAISQPILCYCQACGRRHEGMFYQCSTTCTNFTIHGDCAFLPEKLLIQDRTDGAFHHTHPLTISYSFPDQRAKHFPRCRVCGGYFFGNTEAYHWIYKCDKCMYYAHLDCATSRTEPFMSIFLSADFGKTIKNFEDVDHPDLLRLPFPDETYSLPKHSLFFQEESGSSSYEGNLKHISHQHPLILVDVDHGQTSSSSNSLLLIKCHDPMKKTQLLCNGCLRPIMSTMPFYKCLHQSCNDFALHDWCTRLPQEIQNHPDHPQHTLHLIYSNNLPFFFGVFHCAVCDLPCNGFAYGCVECKYFVDVSCGIIPKEITHKAHPNHILSLVQKIFGVDRCHICCLPFFDDHVHYEIRPILFGCKACDIYMHPQCALLLAETTRHKHDKHPIHLSYLPIENHKSEYFCEICEQDLNPNASFYHCKDCVQSIHTACAPLIVKCETETYNFHSRGTYYFVNIKFGGTHNTRQHLHPLSFAQGLELDDRCSRCFELLQYKMIFKCLECRFAIDYDCCKL
ncbi:hypothetical protein Lser_V15G38588 [Lactuca serriola]